MAAPLGLQWNGEANGADLVTYMNDYTQSNNTTFPLAQKCRFANLVMHKLWSLVFEAYAGWQWDDTSQASLPEANINIVINQSDYTLPTDILTIKGIEYLPQNGTTYAKLFPLTDELIRQNNLSEASLYTSTGTPTYYRLISSKLRLYPTPNYNMASGLRLYFDRGELGFVPLDTTKQPGFAYEFHDIVAVGAALEYARVNGTSNFQFLQDLYTNRTAEMKAYYQKRWWDIFPPRLNVRDSTREYM